MIWPKSGRTARWSCRAWRSWSAQHRRSAYLAPGGCGATASSISRRSAIALGGHAIAGGQRVARAGLCCTAGGFLAPGPAATSAQEHVRCAAGLRSLRCFARPLAALPLLDLGRRAAARVERLVQRLQEAGRCRCATSAPSRSAQMQVGYLRRSPAGAAAPGAARPRRSSADQLQLPQPALAHARRRWAKACVGCIWLGAPADLFRGAWAGPAAPEPRGTRLLALFEQRYYFAGLMIALIVVIMLFLDDLAGYRCTNRSSVRSQRIRLTPDNLTLTQLTMIDSHRSTGRSSASRSRARSSAAARLADDLSGAAAQLCFVALFLAQQQFITPDLRLGDIAVSTTVLVKLISGVAATAILTITALTFSREYGLEELDEFSLTELRRAARRAQRQRAAEPFRFCELCRRHSGRWCWRRWRRWRCRGSTRSARAMRSTSPGTGSGSPACSRSSSQAICSKIGLGLLLCAGSIDLLYSAIATTVQVFPLALLSLMTIILALAVAYLSGLLYGRRSRSERWRCCSCSRWSQAPACERGRSLVLDERVHGSADAVALAAATVLDRRYGDARRRGRVAKRGPSHTTGGARGCRARSGPARTDARIHLVRARRARRLPLAVRVHVVAGRHGASARAGVEFGASTPVEGFRAADVRGLDAAGASSRRPSRNSAGRTSGVARAARRAGSTARG